MPGYPLELDLSGRRVLVVGLGAVGRRKLAGLIAAGARVLGIDPAAEPEGWPAGVEIRREAFRAEHLCGVSLAFAAGPAEVNAQVVAEARRLGVWVNAASDPEAGDFTLPAVWREGPLTLTISTSGASPALAAALRDRAAQALGPDCAAFVTLLAELRPEVLARVVDPDGRRQLLAGWADPRWLELWRVQGPETVRRTLREELDRAASGAGDRPEDRG